MMYVNAKTATAVSLLLGALAYPLAGTAQTSTETTTEEEVEIEVIETEDAGQVEEQAEQTGETMEQQAEQTGETVEQQAEQTGETASEELQGGEILTEGDVGPTPPPGMVITTQKEGEWLASDVLDRDIVNQNGEEIGEISDILLRDDGPEGVIVDVGGFLGIGKKQIAVKWDELSFSQEGIVLDSTEEALKNAEEFVSLEDQQREAEIQAQREQAEEQAAQQAETLPTTGTETETEATGEVEVETESQ